MTDRPTVVFDLDGTLIDTIGDLVATLNVVLGEAGCAPLPEAAARSMIGHGAKALLTRGLAARGHVAWPERLDALHQRFLAHYAANIAVHSRPLPGLAEALDRLAASGARLAVLTNKLDHLAHRLLDELGLTRRFAAIVGGDTFPFGKPDPRVYRATVERAGGIVTRSVMVGDSKTDLDTGRNAGVPVILVAFGYTDVPVTELGADRLIGAWPDLVPALEALTVLT